MWKNKQIVRRRRRRRRRKQEEEEEEEENKKKKKKKKKKKQDMTLPFARLQAKLGGSIRLSFVVLQTKFCSRKTYSAIFDLF